MGLSFLKFCGYILVCTEIAMSVNSLMQSAGYGKINKLIRLHDLMCVDLIALINKIYGLELLMQIGLSFTNVVCESIQHFISHRSINTLDHVSGSVVLCFNLMLLIITIFCTNNFREQLKRFGILFHNWELSKKNKKLVLISTEVSNFTPTTTCKSPGIPL